MRGIPIAVPLFGFPGGIENVTGLTSVYLVTLAVLTARHVVVFLARHQCSW
ncbi:MAG: hypothetical protein QXG03_10955 [Halalkalicoccus sp.]